MKNEYALGLNKYVIDYCETTPQREQSAIDSLIHQVCLQIYQNSETEGDSDELVGKQ